MLAGRAVPAASWQPSAARGHQHQHRPDAPRCVLAAACAPRLQPAAVVARCQLRRGRSRRAKRCTLERLVLLRLCHQHQLGARQLIHLAGARRGPCAWGRSATRCMRGHASCRRAHAAGRRRRSRCAGAARRRGVGAPTCMQPVSRAYEPTATKRAVPGIHLLEGGVASVCRCAQAPRGAAISACTATGSRSTRSTSSSRKDRVKGGRGDARARAQHAARRKSHRVHCIVTVRLLHRCSRICGRGAASTMAAAGRSRHWTACRDLLPAPVYGTKQQAGVVN